MLKIASHCSLLQLSELNWPEQLCYGLLNTLVIFSFPQSINQVFNRNDSVRPNTLSDQNVITVRSALMCPSFEVTTLVDLIVNNFLWGLSIHY
jgi:hypothetical protein